MIKGDPLSIHAILEVKKQILKNGSFTFWFKHFEPETRIFNSYYSAQFIFIPPFSSRSSQPRNQIRVSCIAGGLFTNWTIREALIPTYTEIHIILTLIRLDGFTTVSLKLGKNIWSVILLWFETIFFLV